MERKLLVEDAFGLLRVALLEDGRLVECRVEEAGGKNRAGSIYKGRVKNILPGMQAAFVDIGEEKNAYLSQKDLLPGEDAPIGQRIKPGDELLVQVLKESDGNKGAKLTMRLSLPGRLLVLKPFEPGLGASKRMGDEHKRASLKRALAERCPGGMGLVLRTAAQFEEESALMQALEEALDGWAALQRAAASKSAPCLLRAESDLLEKDLRDLANESLVEIVVSGEEACARAREILRESSPPCLERLRAYRGETPLFDAYNLEKELQAALKQRVPLKSGGFLVIETTEALTVVDVNSGAYVGRRGLAQTALEVNLEAAQELARQLRLRDIGGAVIVDFIDMQDQGHRQRLVEALQAACRADRTPVMVHGITRLGLVELTRRRTRQSLAFDLTRACPLCGGEGKLLKEEHLLRRGLREALRKGCGLRVRQDLWPLANELAQGSGVALRRDEGLDRAYALETEPET